MAAKAPHNKLWRMYAFVICVRALHAVDFTPGSALQEIRKIVATANPQSTIVLISSPTAYQDACACARQRSIFVERLFSTDAVSRFIDESNANWMCSLKQFLNSNNITGVYRICSSSHFAVLKLMATAQTNLCIHADWRLENRDPGTTAKKESLAGGYRF